MQQLLKLLGNLLSGGLGGPKSDTREGYAFIPGTEIQAKQGSELLRGPGYTEPMGQPIPAKAGAYASASPAPVQTQAPRASQAPIQTPPPVLGSTAPQSGYGELTPVPRAPGYPEIPDNIRDILFQVFEDNLEATSSAQVLTHPSQTTHIKGEIPRPKNTGENPRFDTRAENKNKDGSIDRGLFQINSNTYADFARRRPDLLQKAGITSWDDMFDPLLNARMADIIASEQGWQAWYGAPRELRKREYGQN